MHPFHPDVVMFVLPRQRPHAYMLVSDTFPDTELPEVVHHVDSENPNDDDDIEEQVILTKAEIECVGPRLFYCYFEVFSICNDTVVIFPFLFQKLEINLFAFIYLEENMFVI